MGGDDVGRGGHLPAILTLQPSCPDLFRASTSRRRLARARLAPRCLTAWMPGTSPGMRRWGKAGRDWGRRRETPAYRNPSLDPRDPPETRSYSSLLPRPKELNRTAVDLFRASTSRRRLARARLAPRCLTAWMPGTSPGMTRWGKAGRDRGRRRETPACRNPSLDPRDPPETRSYSSLSPRPQNLNRTAVDLFRASTPLRRLARARRAPRCRRRGCPEQVRA